VAGLAHQLSRPARRTPASRPEAQQAIERSSSGPCGRVATIKRLASRHGPALPKSLSLRPQPRGFGSSRSTPAPASRIHVSQPSRLPTRARSRRLAEWLRKPIFSSSAAICCCTPGWGGCEQAAASPYQVWGGRWRQRALFSRRNPGAATRPPERTSSQLANHPACRPCSQSYQLLTDPRIEPRIPLQWRAFEPGRLAKVRCWPSRRLARSPAGRSLLKPDDRAAFGNAGCGCGGTDDPHPKHREANRARLPSTMH